MKPGLKHLNLDKTFTLVIVSHERCAYCSIALEELKVFSKNSELNIVVIDYSDPLKPTGRHDEYHSIYNFVDANEFDLIERPNFFPQFFLIKNINDVVWHKNGWRDKLLKKIRKEL